MKFVIIGGGPTGMRLADNLSENGRNKVVLIEGKKRLGGCWKLDWVEGYMCEHSPRIMTESYKKVLELVSTLPLEDPYREVYGSKLQTSLKFIKYNLQNLSTTDNVKFLTAVYSIGKGDRRVMTEWIDDNNISTSGRKGIKNLCLSLADHPDRLACQAFFRAIRESFSNRAKMIQFRHGDKWIQLWEERLNGRENLQICKGEEVRDITTRGSKVTSVLVGDRRVRGDIFIFAIPLWNLKELGKICSSDRFRSNWMPWDGFKKFCSDSSYSSIGIQLHFTSPQGLSKNWCQTCMGDWSIITLITSDFLDQYSKDPEIREVWSCALVDFYTKSKYLDKTPGKLELQEIVDEVVRQLRVTSGKHLKPKKVTVNIDWNEKGKWDMRESAYTVTPKGPLRMKGELENLYAVGPHNLPDISVMEGGFQAADIFCKKISNKNEL